MLVRNGYREAVFTGVDICYYGRDLPDRLRLGDLVRNVLARAPDLGGLVLPPPAPARPAAAAPPARWVDVFCERGAFDADQSRAVLAAGGTRAGGAAELRDARGAPHDAPRASSRHPPVKEGADIRAGRLGIPLTSIDDVGLDGNHPFTYLGEAAGHSFDLRDAVF